MPTTRWPDWPLRGSMRCRAELLLALLLGCGPKSSSLRPASVVRQATDAARAEELLVEGAEDLDVSVRRRALALLVQVSPEPASSSWGERGLWDPSPVVQGAVIEALAEQLPRPESLLALQRYVARPHVDPYRRCAAASRLARSGDTAAAPVVIAAYRDEAELWRAAPCALAAAELGDAEALATLEEALQLGELPLELVFIADLGRSGLALGPMIRDNLDGLEEELQLPLAGALLGLDEAGGAAMFRQALSSEDDEVYLEAVDLLTAQVPGSPAGQSAVRLLRRSSRRVATDLALIELGAADPGEAIETLLSLDREERAQAARALGGWLASPAADGNRRMRNLSHQALLAALQDEEELVQLAAIRSLTSTGRPEDAEALTPLLEEGSLQIRVEAAGAVLMLLRNMAIDSAGPVSSKF